MTTIPPKHQTISDHILDYLKSRIILGKYEPGSKLNILHLANELNLSQTSIREVLSVLENKLLVKHVPRKGYFVTDLSISDGKDIYQTRLMIECFAIDILKSNNYKLDFDIPYNMDKYDRSFFDNNNYEPEDILTYFKSIVDFHKNLVKSTNNYIIYNNFINLMELINRYQVIQWKTEYKVPNIAINEHLNIYNEINNGNYDKAKETLTKHIQWAFELLKNTFNASNVFLI